MLSISDLRKYFIPTFHHSVQDVHERLAVQTYQPVKDFLNKPNPELESDLFVECFITDDEQTLPVSINGVWDDDVWIVEYVTFGKLANVHTRVMYSQSVPPVVDPFIIVETRDEQSH
jgi:hypothetical protein